MNQVENQNLKQKLSIIIPVFNETESLKELNARIIQAIFGLPFDYEIIYIDDGSADNSFNIISELHQQNQKIRAIQFRRNFGKSAALAAGFKEAGGDLVITMDSDLQDEPLEISNLIKKIGEGYDMVSGWKRERKDSFIKLVSSKIFNFTVSALTGIKLHDFNCGFKIYQREVIKNIEVYGELHRFLPVLAHQKGYKVGELKVKHNERKFGESRYGKFGLRRAVNYFLDIINVLLITKYTKKPLHFFGAIGLSLSFIGFIICAYLTILRVFTGSIQSHLPLLIFGVLLIITGAQLISLGLLSEIMIQNSVKKEKSYNIKKKII
ncbi:glycosyltransferase family 2 protein [Candidatus Parcubacteria bacterium]|nr:glycosyltransferase family 2 protein [Candidatus Parcubacteria bacterium]